MKEYKRLTDGYSEDRCYYNQMDFIDVDEMYNRLAELEDKIEDGTLIELPCKVGDTIFHLGFDKEEPCGWCEYDHSGFGDVICELNYDEYPTVEEFINGEKICPKFKMCAQETTFRLDYYITKLKFFGITWFLTKAEAEAKLKELQGEEK